MHEEQTFSIPKTLLFNVLDVNIWVIFKIFPKMELLIPLYNNI